MDAKDVIVTLALTFVYCFGIAYAYRAFGHFSNAAAPAITTSATSTATATATATATVTRMPEYFIPVEDVVHSSKTALPVLDAPIQNQLDRQLGQFINILPWGAVIAIFALVLAFVLLLALYCLMRHRANKSRSKSKRGTPPAARPLPTSACSPPSSASLLSVHSPAPPTPLTPPPTSPPLSQGLQTTSLPLPSKASSTILETPTESDSSALCAKEALTPSPFEAPIELNAAPNEVDMDAGVPAKSSGQYGAHICATIPRHSSSLEHPPPVNGRANANRGDGAAAVTIPHKAQWNLLLQMVESSMPHVRRLVDALLDCPAAGDGSVMSTVDEIVVPTKMTCYFCGPNKAVVDRHRHLRFSADMFGLINLCATRQWAEAGTFLQHALDMYTAESDDYANNSCAMCWRDRGFMRAMFVSLPSTLMFELDRFNDMRGTNRNVGHLSFPINMDMAPHMVLGRSYTQITTYGLYAVVANNGEREGAGEYTCHVMTDDKCWYFCRAGHGRERVSEETVPGVNACMVFYRRRTPGWNIPECSEPWDVSDPLVL